MLSWLNLLFIKLLLLHLVGCLHCCIRDARPHKHHIFLEIRRWCNTPPHYLWGLTVVLNRIWSQSWISIFAWSRSDIHTGWQSNRGHNEREIFEFCSVQLDEYGISCIVSADVDRSRDVDGSKLLKGVLCGSVKLVRQAKLDSKCNSRRKPGDRG